MKMYSPFVAFSNDALHPPSKCGMKMRMWVVKPSAVAEAMF